MGHAHTIFRECGSDGRSQRAHGETHSAKPELFLQMQSGDISDSPRASIEFWGSSSLFSLSRLLPLLAPKNNAQVFALNAAKSRSALWGRLHFTRATSRASCERRASGECVWEHHLSFLSFFFWGIDSGVAFDSNTRPVAAAARAPHLEVDEIFVDAMMAIPASPRVIAGPPTSLQTPSQGINVYTCSLAAGEISRSNLLGSAIASIFGVTHRSISVISIWALHARAGQAHRVIL